MKSAQPAAAVGHNTTNQDKATSQDTMQAIVQRRYGTVPEEVLHLERIARPRPAAGEVLIQVRAAGVDRGTWHMMAGQPYLMRLALGFRGPRNRVPGLDVAGTVVATGPGVTRFAVGDEVFGIARGSFAEYAVAREAKLARKPAALTFARAAALAVSGLTALQGLRDAGHIQTGQKVLVIGASGGVGSYAVQLAKVFGAEVTGVGSTAKADLVRAIGADHVIDYHQQDFADGRQRYDLILDIGGNTPLSRLRRALTPRGTLVIAGSEGAKGERAQWTGMGRQFRALALSPLTRQRLTMFVSRHRRQDLETLRQLTESGQVTPVVEQTCPLTEVPQAIRRLHAGQVRGKLVITT
ncbi:MAG TPA: NAD(P)-dependent alcohol dehydrogenase [Streptosporangiaceae bacterium]|nr:NAD(P)-dependent alcohol dehydrogenase [Streptosporangiaceae bacterium]